MIRMKTRIVKEEKVKKEQKKLERNNKKWTKIIEIEEKIKE